MKLLGVFNDIFKIMENIEIFIKDFMLKHPIYYSIIIAVVGFVISHFFSPYVKQKFKNQANKEDIGRITEETEKVRFEYSKS